MSVAAITAAWKVECEPAQKLVLLALADHANDETYKCWPSLTHICKKTGLGRSTVARCLKTLEANRIIGRSKRGTQTTMYTLNVANWCQSGTSATAGLVPQRDHGSASVGLEVVPERDGGSATVAHGTVSEPSKEPSVSRKGGARGAHRLPEGWEPTDEVRQQCRDMGLPDDAVEWELEKFRDHWMAATKNASKKDWGAAFRNWCRKAVEFKRERQGSREAEEQEEHYI